jgi:hypothetical protein
MMRASTLAGFAFALITALTVTTVLPPVFAQEQPQAQPSEQPKVDTPRLQSFAKVYVQIEKIRQIYEPRLGKAQGPEESQAIQTEAQSQIQQALASEGMTAESYTQIVDQLNSDDQLRAKALQLIDEERKKS